MEVRANASAYPEQVRPAAPAYQGKGHRPPVAVPSQAVLAEELPGGRRAGRGRADLAAQHKGLQPQFGATGPPSAGVTRAARPRQGVEFGSDGGMDLPPRLLGQQSELNLV